MTTLPALDPLPVWLAAAALAVLFAHAALAKLADRPLFEQHLAAYRVPDAALSVLGLALPLAELATAALLLSPARPLGALAAAGLLGLYAAAMARPLSQGRRPDCGCGAAPLPVSWALVARNALLVVLALAVAGAPLQARAMGLADFAVTAAGVVLATLLYAAAHQVLRGRPGATARRA